MNTIIFPILVACYATTPRFVRPSVHPSVRWLVPILLFWAFWAHCSCPNDSVSFSITAPALLHAILIAVYPALFHFVVRFRCCNLSGWRLIFRKVSNSSFQEIDSILYKSGFGSHSSGPRLVSFSKHRKESFLICNITSWVSYVTTLRKESLQSRSNV